MATNSRYNRATKGWKNVQFQPNRVLQDAELDEVQDIRIDEVKQLIRMLMKDGEVIRGCEIVIQSTTVTLTNGQIYFDGYFHDFASDSVTITAVGEESIGIVFTEVEITENEDSDLLDAIAGDNFGLPGAYRIKFTSTLVANDPASTILYTLRDGVLVGSNRTSRFDEIFKILAQRTNDESGSYIVAGLKGKITARDANQYNLVVSAGLAYVQGWPHTVSTDTKNPIDRALDSRIITAEAHTFSTGSDTYALNAPPVKAITLVTAIVEETVVITRGASPDTMDLMPFTPVSSIVSVTKDAGATVYTTPADYLVSGDNIDWSPAGSEPSPGMSYDVVQRYVKTMVVSTDYQLTGDSVDFSPAGDNPVDTTVFNVTYQSYLPRKDLLVMDKAGQLSIVRGQSSIYPRLPQQPAGVHLIMTVEIPANGAIADVVINHSKLYRQTFNELARLRDRVYALEYNAAVTDLEQAAANTLLPTAKLAIFADAFLDNTKTNTGHGDHSATNDRFGTLLPGFTFDAQPLAGVAGDHTELSYTEVVALSQPFGTEISPVNPYAAVSIVGLISCDPQDDIWINEATVERVWGFWALHRGRWGLWVQDPNDPTKRIRTGSPWVIGNVAVDRTFDEETVVNGESRAQTIAVTGSSFAPNADNLALTFDEESYALTPTGGTAAGTDVDTIKADGDGIFTATFDIPAGIEGGAKAVTISNGTHTGNSSGETQFVIANVLRTHVIRRIPPRPQTTPFSIPGDPLAESFQFNTSMFLTGCNLYFATKASAQAVVVSIRTLVNGFPGPDILTEVAVLPGSITTSADGSVATRITFPRPAFIEGNISYCIVIATEATEYAVFISRLGGSDLVSGAPVSVNPYTGILFSSANAESWTPDQSADLKFDLYRAEFTTPKVLTFDQLTVDGSMFTLLADQIVPADTSVLWEYSSDGGTVWTAIEPDSDVNTGQMLTTLDLKATLNGTALVSPLVALKPLLLTNKWDLQSNHITPNIVLSAYTEIRVYLDIHVPTGTSINLFYAKDGTGTTWITMGAGTYQRTVNSLFSEYLWTVTGISGTPVDLMLKIELNANTARTLPAVAQRFRAIAN